jgi:signal transduction histidine kinase
VIFEKFWQAKASLRKDQEGTGLGLAIVKAIVEKLWWKVTIESELDKWSTFTIRIPVDLNKNTQDNK